MKNKKGFTLIELLAIIVILAIIAVITVPIVLNIIENARKGAVQNSALGYIDAVDKYYASRLSVDSSFQLVDGIYSIVDNGYLSDGIGTYEVKFDGQAPANGFVQVVKGNAINACVGFEEYAVIITDGSISDTAKGECTSVSEIASSNQANEEPLDEGTEYLFPYVSTGNDKEQTLEIIRSGYYKLEVWGAQGGSNYGGYGGYTSGYVYLTAGTDLFINVGGKGGNNIGGYNGGGDGQYYAGGTTPPVGFGGGGATHIALKSGVLSSLSNDVSDVLIVAGGGGGGSESNNWGGHGGGSIGNKGIGNYAGSGGTQFVGGSAGTGTSNGTAGAFGQGGSASNGTTASGTYASGGGGGGFYGGGGSAYQSGQDSSGAGGSGYIGNSNLLNGMMYCYGCSGAMTISTTGSNKDATNCPNGYSGDALTHCAKSGNGYAKITYIGKTYTATDLADGISFDFEYIVASSRDQMLNIPSDGYYKLEVWGAQGGSSLGGYGGYSSGIISLNKGDNIYVNVGGQGGNNAGGYNGGGTGQYYAGGTTPPVGFGGGGATHMALTGGTLSSLSSSINNVLIVAGGGGGKSESDDRGGHGGGFTGVNGIGNYAGTGGTQGSAGTSCSNCTAGGFGLGGSASNGTTNSGTWASGGGGGGFYGGGASGYQTGNGENGDSSGAGGSGYIGSSRLSSGVMYCYGCTEDGNDGTRTVSTTGSNKDSVNCPNSYSSSALTNCAKAGSGYAKITYLGNTLN